MKKVLYISLFVFLFISCEKKVIVPNQNSDFTLDSNSQDDASYSDNETARVSYLEEKNIGDLIIDPNSRDDVGDKKDKKPK